MSKKLLIILFCLVSFTSFGQDIFKGTTLKTTHPYGVDSLWRYLIYTPNAAGGSGLMVVNGNDTGYVEMRGDTLRLRSNVPVKYPCTCPIGEDTTDWKFGAGTGSLMDKRSTTGSGAQSFTAGRDAINSGISAIAIGDSVRNTTSKSLVIGYESYNTGYGGLVIGDSLRNTGLRGSVIGNIAFNTGQDGLAIGYGANNSGSNGIAIGESAANSGNDGITVGESTINTASFGTVIGGASQNSGDNGTAIGGGINEGTTGMAIGFGAYNRINKSTNISGAIVIRKSEISQDAETYQFYSGAEVVIVTRIDTPTATGTITITLPSGVRFFPDEVGFIATVANTVTVQPTISYGVTGNNAALLVAAPTTGISAAGDRDRQQVLVTADGQTSLTAEVTIGATATELVGRYYFKGFLIESQ